MEEATKLHDITVQKYTELFKKEVKDAPLIIKMELAVICDLLKNEYDTTTWLVAHDICLRILEDLSRLKKLLNQKEQ